MRFLLLPLLLLSLSFACDQPYEEVYGIKIGCSLEEIKGLDKFSAMTPMLGADALSYIDQGSEDFFNTVGLLYFDNSAEGVVLTSRDGTANTKNFSLLLDELSKRWGDGFFLKEGVYVINTVNSDVIGVIVALNPPGSNKINVVYRSKKLIEREERRVLQEQNEMKQQFQKL